MQFGENVLGKKGPGLAEGGEGVEEGGGGGGRGGGGAAECGGQHAQGDGLCVCGGVGGVNVCVGGGGGYVYLSIVCIIDRHRPWTGIDARGYAPRTYTLACINPRTQHTYPHIHARMHPPPS